MQDPLVDAHIRSARYQNVDGLSEIAVGLQVTLVPLCLYGVTQTSRGTPGRIAVVLALALGLPAAILLSGRLVVAIRKRFTYPRTGFVAYRRQQPQTWAFGIAGAFTLVLLFLALRGLTASWVAWLFAFQGLVPGGLMIYCGRLLGIRRFQVTGVIQSAFGVALAIAGVGLTQGMILYWAGMGMVFLASGAVAFWRYSRAHPALAEAP